MLDKLPYYGIVIEGTTLVGGGHAGARVTTVVNGQVNIVDPPEVTLTLSL
jgi:hypothetical protein